MANELGWKVMAAGGAMLAGLAARKLLDVLWEKTTGHPPPQNPDSPETTLVRAVSWAAVSGIVYGLARMLATRNLARVYERTSGRLPESLEEANA